MVVPLLVSTLLVYVAGELVLRQWAGLLLLAWIGVAGLAQTGPGERATARIFYGGRLPLLHERHTLAPVARELLAQGCSTDRSALLVGRGDNAEVVAVGPHTVVVTRGLVENVRSGVLPPQVAAAVIAHELAVVRSGLLRLEPAVYVLLAPWRAFLVLLMIGWGIVATFVPRRLMHLSVLVVGAAGLWLGHAEHPIHYAGTAVLVLGYLTWWALHSWGAAREAVGDQSLAGTDLGAVYGNYLAETFTSDHTRDRAVRLQHPGHPFEDHPFERYATAVGD